MVGSKSSWIESEIKTLKNKGLYNEAPTLKTPVSAHVKLNGKPLINFASNNYLGLANNRQIIKAACKAMEKYGVGPAAVRSIAGTSVLHKKLEQKLAKFKKVQKVLTFCPSLSYGFERYPSGCPRSLRIHLRTAM